MPGPEAIEFLSFRRTFTLLILLVVLPSAGLSGFGIVAIVNERAAVEKRITSFWEERLATVQSQLLVDLSSLKSTQSGSTLVVTSGDIKLSETPFSFENGIAISDDTRLASAVQGLSHEFDALPPTPTMLSIATVQGSFLLVAQKSGDRIVGALVSIAAMNRWIARVAERLSPAVQDVSFIVVPIQKEKPDGVVARFVSGVSEVQNVARGDRELAQITLPSPMENFRLAAISLGEDPVAEASLRNRVVYVVLLVFFYATLIVGVVFTVRSLYREAKLSRLKTDFVSLVSHELRTPLTSIRMFIEMFSMGRLKDPQDVQTVLDLLSKETSRLSAMIENVLDWARIESGNKQYHLIPVALHDIVENAIAAFRAQRLGATMNFRIELNAESIKVAADKEAISGAVLNLLQNAFKYTGENKEIVLRTHIRHRQAIVEVEDNGIGIARREQKRIFERFYRVDSLLTRDTEGSGLGLAIAQRIAKAHGGRLSVDSTVGRGSIFRIHLPIDQ